MRSRTFVLDILVAIEHSLGHVTHDQLFHHIRVNMLGDMAASRSKLYHFTELAFDVLEGASASIVSIWKRFRVVFKK